MSDDNLNQISEQTKISDEANEQMFKVIENEAKMIAGGGSDIYKILNQNSNSLRMQIIIGENLQSVVTITVPNSRLSSTPRVTIMSELSLIKGDDLLETSEHHLFGPADVYSHWQALYETSTTLDSLFNKVENKLKGNFLSHIAKEQLFKGKYEVIRYVIHMVIAIYTAQPNIAHMRLISHDIATSKMS